MLFFSVQRAPESITEHPLLCLSHPCPWANTPIQLSLGPLVPAQEMLWRILTHSCYSWIAVWPSLTWDLTFHLAIATLLSCHRPHLCWPCLDAETGIPSSSQWCHWHGFCVGVVAGSWLPGVCRAALLLSIPIPLVSHTPPVLAACTAAYQGQQHRNVLVAVWGPHLMIKLLLPLLNFLVSQGTTASPISSISQQRIWKPWLRSVGCIPLLPVWRNGILNLHKREQWPTRILYRLRIYAFKMGCAWNWIFYCKYRCDY